MCQSLLLDAPLYQWHARIADDMQSRTFDVPMLQYKKDNLLALSRALKISTEGNMKDLIARIKEHLHDHPELKENPRFTGLFPGSPPHGQAMSSAPSHPTHANAAVSTSATAHQTSYPTASFEFVSHDNTAHTTFSVHQLPSPSMPNHSVVIHIFPTDTHCTIHTLLGTDFKPYRYFT